MSFSWQPDHSSDSCTSCKAEFGRVYGPSRHHCRINGKLYCSQCIRLAEPIDCVLDVGQVLRKYKVPDSQYTFLTRPVDSSALGKAMTLIAAPTDELKFCAEYYQLLKQETTAWIRAQSLLGCMNFLNPQWVQLLFGICVQASMAELDETTAMTLIGDQIQHRLNKVFYEPCVRPENQIMDRVINYHLSKILQNYYSKQLYTKPTLKEATNFFETSIVPDPYTIHNLIQLWQNGDKPGLRMDNILMEFLAQDPVRNTHILIGDSCLGYEPRLESGIKRYFWSKQIQDFPSYISDSPYLLRFFGTSYSDLCKIEPNISYEFWYSVLCIAGHEPSIQKEIAAHCGLSPEKCFMVLNHLFDIFWPILYDGEQLNHKIQIPCAQISKNPFSTIKSQDMIQDILNKITEFEPRQIEFRHVLSQETNHVGELFQSWHIFPEPFGIENAIMRKVYECVEMVESNPGTVSNIFTSLQFIRQANTNNVIGISNAHHKTQLKIVNHHGFETPPRFSVTMFVTILLLYHLTQFVPLPTPTDAVLSLVEVQTVKDIQYIIAPITFSSIHQIRQHTLERQINADFLVGITAILNTLVQSHMDDLWFCFLEIPNQNAIHAYLNSIKQYAQNDQFNELILQHMINP